MTYGAIPKAMQSPGRGKVAVFISDAVYYSVPMRWHEGWNVAKRSEAAALADYCESNGKADRSRPQRPGSRIALQALARQIRARLK